MLKIEKHIMDNRMKYNTRELDLNDFVPMFHQYTRQALMYIAANVGSKHGVEIADAFFENCRCYPLLQELEKEFDCFFAKMEKGEKIVISSQLVEWLKEYYELFKVYISETVQGWYYDIPFDEGGANI